MGVRGGEHRSTWHSISHAQCRSEKDVIGRILRPLLSLLRWPQPEIHEDVPVHFVAGRQKTNPKAADLALAAKTSEVPKRAWVVIEAKRPGESLRSAEEQAFSYTYMLRAAFFVICNGVDFELWQGGRYEANRQLFACSVADLASRRGELLGLLSRASVQEYFRRNKLPEHSISEFDVSDHLDHLFPDLVEHSLVPRRLHAQGDGETRYVGWRNTTLDLESGSRTFVTGVGGRGKTSVLRLLCTKALRELSSRKRVPLLVSASSMDGSLFTALAQQFEHTVPSLADAATVSIWLKAVDSLIVVDDWHMLNPKAKQLLLSELAHLDRAAVVIAARRSAIPPEVCVAFELRAYSTGEVDEFIKTRLGDDAPFLDLAWLRSRVPDDFEALLREPAILALYISLVRRSGPFGGWEVPQNLPDLMDACMTSGLKTTHANPELRADVISMVCKELADTSSSLDLSIIANRLADLRVAEDASDFAAELLDIGIWRRVSIGAYEYSHELWRHHFQSKKQIRDGMTDAELVAWLDGHDADELQLAVLFAAGRIRSREQQGALFSVLLDRYPVLYLRALVGRRNVVDETDLAHGEVQRWCTSQYRDGYYDFVTRCTPGMKSVILPWNGVPAAQLDSCRFSVNGLVFGSGLSLSTGLSLTADPEERVGVWSSFTCAPDAGAGRIAGARRALKEVEEALGKNVLPPVPEIAEEQLLKWASCLTEADPYGPVNEATTLREFSSRLEDRPFVIAPNFNYFADGNCVELDSADEAAEFAHNERAFHRDTITFSELGVLIARVIDRRGADTTLEELQLPGPDRPEFGPRFEVQHSPQRKRDRLHELLHRVTKVYAGLCRDAFTGLAPLMLGGRGPIRARCVIVPQDSGRDRVQLFWEPVEQDDIPVVDVLDEFLDDEVIWRQLKLRYAALGRRIDEISISYGRVSSWTPGEPVVTQTVRSMLLADLKRIRRILRRAP